MPLIDVNGLPINADVAAGAGPPVVLVAQIGTAGSSWRPVIDLLTTGPTVVTYDRPGTGASPPRPAPNPPLPYSGFAAELVAMLDALGVAQPVVLVGHSVGSLIVRAFAAANPGRVAGMVHVDGSWPGMDLGPWVGPHIDGDGPECTAFDTVRGAAEIAGVDWPKVPGVVVVRSPGTWAGETPFDPAVDRFWHEQAELLAHDLAVPRIVAVDAGHQIPREVPQLVAFAVDEVVRAVRGRRPAAFEGDAVAAVGGTLVE
jgi:pimeloyl-ACP methyl ester carboxylesterase